MQTQTYILAFILALIMSVPFSGGASNALNDSLIYHVYFGGGKDVFRLLSKGADPNTRDDHDWPALAIATDRSDDQAYPIAKALVSAGANVNAGANGQYPIVNSIHNNNADLVRLLITHGAQLNVVDEKGRSVDQLAAEASDKRIYYYLSKLKHEKQQLRQFLYSRTHLRQMLKVYTFSTCAYQYWGFYLKSKQDKQMDIPALEDRLRLHARNISASSTKAATYFPTIYQSIFQLINYKTRDTIFQQLNSMISNRNRRTRGVGTMKDLHKRCDVITENALKKI